MKYFLDGTWVNDATISELPKGATALTDDEWAARHGTPYVPSKPELVEKALAFARSVRGDPFKVLDGLQASALTLGQTQRARDIETAKQGLRDLTAIDLTPYTTLEQMEQAVLAAYRAIANAAPADVQGAFQI